MHPRDIHGTMGLVEQRYSPYGYGDDTPQKVDSGITDVAHAALCASVGGSWDSAKKQCTSPSGGGAIDPVAQACINIGGVWDSTKNLCLPPGSQATPPPEKDNTALYVVLGAVALGIGYYMSRPKSAARNGRRRARRNKTDFDRLKDCSNEVRYLRHRLGEKR